MVQMMTEEEARDLLASCDKTANHKYEPEGTFVVFHGCDSWDAIDNSTGDAWVENFTSLGAALKWLNREEGDEDEDGDPHKPTLCELLPLVQGPVKILAIHPGPLTWSAFFDSQDDALRALSKHKDGQVLGWEALAVSAKPDESVIEIVVQACYKDGGPGVGDR